MKILYKDVRGRHETLKFGILKDMVRDICEGVEFEELYTAISNGKEGIYCRTVMGGKKFWDAEELTKLFVRKNQEKKRFRL